MTNRAVDTFRRKCSLFSTRIANFWSSTSARRRNRIRKPALRVTRISFSWITTVHFPSLLCRAITMPRARNSTAATARAIRDSALGDWSLQQETHGRISRSRLEPGAHLRRHFGALRQRGARPFNTTINMDGKLSAQPGVNERFSSGLVDRYQLFFLRATQRGGLHSRSHRSRVRTLLDRSFLARKCAAGRSSRSRRAFRLLARLLRPVLFAGGRDPGPAAFGCFHRRRLVLVDGLDQRGPAAIAAAIK